VLDLEPEGLALEQEVPELEGLDLGLEVRDLEQEVLVLELEG